MDAKGFELLMSAKILGSGGVGAAMDAKGFERLMAAKILGKGGGGKIKELEGIPPLTFTANGQPLLDYLISGNTEQTGTPTPENPVDVAGCGERTENLWDGKETSLTNRQVTSTGSICSTFVITIPGTYTVKCFLDHIGTEYVYCKTYTISTDTYGPAKYLSLPEASAVQTVTVTETVDNDTVFLIYNPLSSYVTTTAELFIKTQLCVVPGSTAPDHYIPYGYKLPILSNSTVTDIYLGEVPTTRRIKKLVLTGEEYWTKNTGIINFNAYSVTVSNYYERRYVGLSSHYATVDNVIAEEGVYFGQGINFLTPLSDEIDTIDKWKSYLAAQYTAGTPVIIWYVLAEPETGIVNEALMKIGDYADTVSKEQTGVSIPTNKGSTTLDVDTTIKPSNVYIKYKS